MKYLKDKPRPNSFMLRLYWISESAIHLSKFLIRVRRRFSPITFPLILWQERQEAELPAHFRSIHEQQNNVTGPIYERLYRIRAPSVSRRRSKWLLKFKKKGLIYRVYLHDKLIFKQTRLRPLNRSQCVSARVTPAEPGQP